MNKILLTLILGVFLISFASAEIQTLGTFPVNEEINLIQICSNCTFNNITYIFLPDSTLINFNIQMTKDGTFYNYTLNSGNVTQLGEYIINGIGDLDGVDTDWNYNLFVTTSGAERINEGEGFTLFSIILILIMTIIFFIIATIFVNNFAFKVFFGSLSVLLLISTIGFGVTIMQQNFGAFSNLVSGYSLFFRLFMILLGAAGIGLIFFLVVFSLKMFNRSRGLIE